MRCQSDGFAGGGGPAGPRPPEPGGGGSNGRAPGAYGPTGRPGAACRPAAAGCIQEGYGARCGPPIAGRPRYARGSGALWLHGDAGPCGAVRGPYCVAARGPG
ncbi:hypothetical protein BFL43_09885 [Williamsia sp. 1135]|nr:hypothetical protein BFL43_09885 [Williamsia sp. 1135]